MDKISYRDSHKYQSKGSEYEAYYQNKAWQKFLWLREQEILIKILKKYFAGIDIHLLDFACGTGRITEFLENRVKTSTGVDVSGSMLAVAKEKLKRTELIETDITAENIFKPGKFNLITAFRFFLNAETEMRSAAMKVLAELLDENGCLIFNNHQNSGSPWIRLRHAHYRKKNPEGIYNVMSIEQMKKLAEGAGLDIVEIYPAGFFNPPKIPVPNRLKHAIDRTAGKIRFLNRFSEEMTAGRGFIAICIVIFGGWSPIRILLGALFFSLIDSLQLYVQVWSIIPYPLLIMMPYLLTIIVVVAISKKAGNIPRKLSIPYQRGEAT